MKIKDLIKSVVAIMLLALVCLVLTHDPSSVKGQGIGVNTAVVSTPAPPGVSSQFVATTGTTGQTSYCYWVVPVYPIGMGAPISSACLANANATLDSSNYNTITWQSPSSSVTGYWVIRSSNATFPGTGTVAVNSSVIAATTFSQTDQSNTLNAFTFSPASYAYYNLGINNKDYGLPALQVLNSAGTLQKQWYMNDNVHRTITSVEGTVTVAALHAVPVIVTAVNGVTLRVEGVFFQAVGGNAATCTAVNLTDTAGTPIVAVSVPQANLTSGTVNTEATSGMTLTTFASDLTAGKGLELSDTGGQCTTMTSLKYRVFYKILP